nr:hypothetical protein [Tanacetum cinerariifolium]
MAGKDPPNQSRLCILFCEMIPQGRVIYENDVLGIWLSYSAERLLERCIIRMTFVCKRRFRTGRTLRSLVFSTMDNVEDMTTGSWFFWRKAYSRCSARLFFSAKGLIRHGSVKLPESPSFWGELLWMIVEHSSQSLTEEAVFLDFPYVKGDGEKSLIVIILFLLLYSGWKRQIRQLGGLIKTDNLGASSFYIVPDSAPSCPFPSVVLLAWLVEGCFPRLWRGFARIVRASPYGAGQASLISLSCGETVEMELSGLIEFHTVIQRYVIVKDLYQKQFLYSMIGDLLIKFWKRIQALLMDSSTPCLNRRIMSLMDEVRYAGKKCMLLNVYFLEVHVLVGHVDV